jgi:hypothetical protein
MDRQNCGCLAIQELPIRSAAGELLWKVAVNAGELWSSLHFTLHYKPKQAAVQQQPACWRLATGFGNQMLWTLWAIASATRMPLTTSA